MAVRTTATSRVGYIERNDRNVRSCQIADGLRSTLALAKLLVSLRQLSAAELLGIHLHLLVLLVPGPGASLPVA